MADRHADVLIVGAGPAGSACAEALREGGFDGSILLVGREEDAPYDRPPISKGYLLRRLSRDDVRLYPDDFWAERDVELATRVSATKLDAAGRVAKLSAGGEVSFDRALLATGANVRRLRVDGAALEGIHYLRTLGNADALYKDACDAETAVLVGGSYIACEVAASLTEMGKKCTLVMLEESPMSAGFGPRVGEFVAALLRERGVELVCGDGLERFEGGERVERVVTAAGRSLPADLVVMGTGAVPDVMLARGAGLELGETGGVACSASLETSAAGIWAAGDICEYDSVVHARRLRIEHWEVARAQGAHAAAAMLGSGEPYAEVPYFWSDLADWVSLEYIGPAESWDEEIVRGSFDDGAFTVFYLAGGRVVAALTAGRSRDLDAARQLIVSRTPVGDRAALGDPDADLTSVLG